MSHKAFLLLFLGMTAVTYIPRMVPVLFLGRLRLGKRVEKFLRLIPYTAMTALVVPGVFTMDTAHPVFGLIGALTAALLAWFRRPAVVCVLAAVAAEFVLYAVF